MVFIRHLVSFVLVCAVVLGSANSTTGNNLINSTSVPDATPEQSSTAGPGATSEKSSTADAGATSEKSTTSAPAEEGDDTTPRGNDSTTVDDDSNSTGSSFLRAAVIGGSVLGVGLTAVGGWYYLSHRGNSTDNESTTEMAGDLPEMMEESGSQLAVILLLGLVLVAILIGSRVRRQRANKSHRNEQDSAEASELAITLAM